MQKKKIVMDNEVFVKLDLEDADISHIPLLKFIRGIHCIRRAVGTVHVYYPALLTR